MQDTLRTSVVHTVGGLHRSLGGPSRSVPETCEALAERGLDVSLVALRFRDEGELVPLPRNVEIKLANGRRLGLLRQVMSRDFGRALNEVVCTRKPTVLHDHGVWLTSNHVAVKIARRASVPIVIAPRGMLSDWALGQRRWLKKVAWRAYQEANLMNASVIHATSDDEARDVRRLGITRPVALVPNGVDAGHFTFRTELPAAAATRTALFLSRLHPKKGIENLVDAWAVVRPDNWRLEICGPSPAAYRTALERRIRRRGLSECVQILDEVDDEGRRRTYAAASLFVLPTLSENFGIVIAEALASGLPVITTKAAPWGELVRHRCGWWVETGVPGLVTALREAIELPAASLSEMGRRGRHLVETYYSWESAAASLHEVYAWLNGSDALPECVDNRWNNANQRRL